MMNLTVEVKAYGISGLVVDMNEAGNVLWVETSNDWVSVPAELASEVVVPVVEVAPAAAETLEDKFEAMLEAEGIEWDAYGEDDSTTYCMDGNLYSVMVTIQVDGYHHCETTHKERMERESDVFNAYGDTENAYANTCTRKTLKGALNFAKKWTDK